MHAPCLRRDYIPGLGVVGNSHSGVSIAMASRSLGLAFLFLLLLALTFQMSSAAIFQGGMGRSRQLLTKINCGNACNVRCLKAGVHDRCLTYCNICCKSCNCVPSGQYGNKDECSCYRDKKNSKGTSKCP